MGIYTLRVATHNDIDQVAGIHKQQFSTHFLGKYSIDLLKQYYASFLGESIFFVGEKSSQIDGFVLGGESNKLQQAKNRFIKHNKYRCIMETLLMPEIYCQALSRIYSIISEVSGNYLNRSSDCSPNCAVGKRIRLLSIAVCQEAQGSGLATQLVQLFEQRIKLDNAAHGYGLSVKIDNQRAIGFYKKIGFTLEGRKGKSIYFTKNIE